MEIMGTLQTRWNYPVRIMSAFPASNKLGYILGSAMLRDGEKAVYIQSPKAHQGY